jgi:hypothetical protein
MFFVCNFSFTIFKSKKNFFIFYLSIFGHVKYDNHVTSVFVVLMIYLSGESNGYDFEIILPFFFWVVISFGSL